MKKTVVTFAQILLTVLVGTTLVSCGATQQELAPDVIFYNGEIVTVDEDFRIAAAVAIRDGRFVAVGSNEEVRRLGGPRTQEFDLAGRMALPGFYNNHIHLRFGRDPNSVYLAQGETLEELKRVLSQHAERRPPGEWVYGRLPEGVLPSRYDLDAAVPDHPVALSRAHATAVNSMALQRARITRETEEPTGGSFDRNDRGELTGILRESPAARRVTRLLPEWIPDDATAHIAARDSLNALLSMGITSVNIAGVRPNELRYLQGTYQRWGDELPRLTTQVRIWAGYDAFDDIEEAIRVSTVEIEDLSFVTGLGNERLKLGAIKMSIDGAGQSAWNLDRPDVTGAIRIPEEALYAVGKRAHDLGWQLGIHAIGDAATEMTVRVLDRILRENPRPDHRHYVHHISVLPPESTIRMIADRDIIVASQPQLFRATPSETFVKRGIRLSYGSDARPYGPLVGIQAAVTRRARDGQVYAPEERVDVKDAIRFYTLGSAYMTFDEANRGSIEVGKLADLVVLSDDILNMDPERISEIQVLRTVIEGRTVYEAGVAASSQ